MHAAQAGSATMDSALENAAREHPDRHRAPGDRGALSWMHVGARFQHVARLPRAPHNAPSPMTPSVRETGSFVNCDVMPM